MQFRSPATMARQYVEGALVIALTSVDSVKTSLSTLGRTYPYSALLLLITMTLFFPLMGLLIGTIVLIVVGAASSALAATALILPAMLGIVGVSLWIWAFGISGAWLVRRTHTVSQLWRKLAAKRRKRVDDKAKQTEAESLEEFVQLLGDAELAAGTASLPASLEPLEPMFDHGPLFEPFDPADAPFDLPLESNDPQAVSTPPSSPFIPVLAAD